MLVDTSVWSISLRRAERRLNPVQQAAVKELKELIGEGRARLVGLVRQELLSGIRSSVQFEKLRMSLRAFPNVDLDVSDYELAAESSNVCRARGVTASLVDALIATVAMARNWSVFTVDADFEHIARILPMKLHAIRR